MVKMKAKDYRARARGDLAAIPKKTYLLMGLVMVLATALTHATDKMSTQNSRDWWISFILSVIASFLTSNGQIFFNRWRMAIHEGSEEPDAWCGLSSQHLWKLLIYGMIEAGLLAILLILALGSLLVNSSSVFMWLLAVAVTVVIVWVELRLSFVVYEIDEDIRLNRQTSVWSEILDSWQLMKGRCWKLFCLNLSFIGWYILVFFTLGILGMWLQPYKSLANAEFYAEAKAGQEEQ